MARKIIKLTETELNSIIKKVIKEQSSYTGYNSESGFNTSPGFQPKDETSVAPIAEPITPKKPAAKTFGVLKKDTNPIGVKSPDLYKGSRGPEVQKYQTALVKLGLSTGTKGADGIFGPTTEWSVGLFQEKNGLPKTGRIDKKTGDLILSKVNTINKTNKLANPTPGIMAGEKGIQPPSPKPKANPATQKSGGLLGYNAMGSAYGKR